MRKLFTTTLMLLIAITAFSQSKIKGSFQIAGQEAPYETIWLLDASGSRLGTTMTDSAGNFTIPVPAGEYEVVSFDSRNQPQAETKVKVGQSQTVRVLLFTSEVEGVQIISRSPIELDKSIVQTVLTREDIQQSGYRSLSEFATGVPGLFIDGGGLIYFRGSRPGAGLFLVDNMKIRGSLELCKASYSSIAFISGALPAEFGDFTGGAIAVTTHNPGMRGWVDKSQDETLWWEATYIVYGRKDLLRTPFGVIGKKLDVEDMDPPIGWGILEAGNPIPWTADSPQIVRSFKKGGTKYHVTKL